MGLVEAAEHDAGGQHMHRGARGEVHERRRGVGALGRVQLARALERLRAVLRDVARLEPHLVVPLRQELQRAAASVGGHHGLPWLTPVMGLPGDSLELRGLGARAEHGSSSLSSDPMFRL